MPKTSKKLIEAQEEWEYKIQRAKLVRKNWKDLFRVDMAKDYIDGKQNAPLSFRDDIQLRSAVRSKGHRRCAEQRQPFFLHVSHDSPNPYKSLSHLRNR